MEFEDQARALRDLARRARRLAQGLTAEDDRQRLLRHAEDLDQQATELELPRAIHAATTAPAVLQVQVQVQQQQEAGPPATGPEDEKPES